MSKSSSEWSPFLDARSYSSRSDVNTDLLHAETPPMPARSTSRPSPPRSIPPPPPMLEVETDSSVSIEMSISYYNMSNYGGSFDTVDLLHGRNHASMSDESPGDISGSVETTSPKYANTSHFSREFRARPFEAAEVDQVPPQFSQFIVDQNNFAEGEPAASSMLKHSRDISDSMGSQATIFSTRPDGSSTLRSRLKSKSRRSKAFPESSSVHLLTRQKAIRSKEGSLAYRFKLRMRKIVAKLRKKFAPVWNFVAGSKRATSSVKRPQKGSKFSLGRKKTRSRLTARHSKISAPVTNPNLGHGASQKPDEVAIGGNHPAASTQLSKYIAEQRHLSGGPSQAASSVESSAPAPPPHLDSSGLKQYLNTASNDAEKEQKRVQQAWKHYLSGVVAQRIKLRQEIALFQMLLANQNVPSLYTKQQGDIASSHNASLDHVEHGKRTVSAFSASESMVSIPDAAQSDDDMSSPEIESDVESLDSNVEKLQRVLNRRSMLGEMLDYESDTQSSSSGSIYSNTSSIPLQSRYGTIRRHANTETSSRYSDSSSSPFPRSNGIPQNLNLQVA